MIYPTINIDLNSNETSINIIDTDFDLEPLITMDGDCLDFVTIMRLLLNQYFTGYEDGYNKCFEDDNFDDGYEYDEDEEYDF